MTGPWSEGRLRDWLLHRLAELTGSRPAELDGGRPIEEYGLSSRDSVLLSGELEELLGIALPATLLWQHPTLDALAAALTGPAPAVSPEGVAPQQEPIAVVGLGCRLPGGVNGPEEFWRLLIEGRDAVSAFPADRWAGFCADGAELERVRAELPAWGGVLADVAGFDAEFFGISPAEARSLDPQQRLVLEVAWHALEHAGIPVDGLRGSDTGVFLGVATNDYGRLGLADPASVDGWSATGCAGSMVANRLSYLLDLRGPSLAVDTACSSSLVAVHQGCQSLRSGETGLVIAGGVNVLLSPAPTLAFARAGALAGDGRCKAFDAAADGIARSEGCGVVVLKRLADARRDGDRVLALIRGSAVNSDGRSNGLTAPSPAAQEALLATAYRTAGLTPSTVDYVEAHGTGTLLGDPIEAGALAAVLGGDRPLLVGSVKTNLGHLEAAAGVAGLIKVVLAMEHGRIPAGLHFAAPNPHIDFDRLHVVTEPTPWPSARPTAGVSGFGFGGTNAHVVLEAPEPVAPQHFPLTSPVTVLLSGRSGDRVRDAAADLANWLESHDGPLADVEHTLALRRGHEPHRVAIVATDRAELLARLRMPLETTLAEPVGPGPVFVFSGYGSQWAGMGRDLLAEPAFADAVTELDREYPAQAGFSLRELLAAGAEVTDLQRSQLAIFGVQVALAALWRSFGVRPAAVIGHSLGEVAAAVVSGSLSVADGVRVLVARSRLLAGVEHAGGGAMAAVGLSVPEFQARRADHPGVEIAVFAGPGQLTVTGPAEQVRRLVNQVAAAGRVARLLPVGGAGHSPAVDPLLPELRTLLADLRPVAAALRWYGSVHADPRRRPECDAEYWAANLRRPVRLRQAVAAAATDGHRVFLEIAPHPVVSGAVAAGAREAGVRGPVVVAGSRRGADERRSVRTALAELHCVGLPIPWERCLSGGDLADLPRTRWRHRRHWLPTGARTASPLGTHVELPGGGHVWQTEVTGAPPSLPELARAAAGTVLGVPAEALDLRGSSAEPVGAVTRLTTMLTGRAGPAASVDVHASTGSGDWRRVAAFEVGVRAAEGGPVERRSPRAVVEGLLGLTEVDAGVPLVELGVDSLLAARIRTAVRRDLGVAVPAAVLLGGGGLDELIEYVESSPVRLLRAGHGDRPLFLFHPAGGSCAVYAPLLAALHPDLPCVGLDRLPDWDFDARVRRYLAEIRGIQPAGPYRLAGWSFGGALAHAVATALVAAGEDVELLALLDTVRPLPDPEPETSVAQRFLRFANYVARTYGRPVALSAAELKGLTEREQLELTMSRVELPPDVLRHQRDSFVDTLIAERATPRPFDGRTVLFRATEPYPQGIELEPRYHRPDPGAGWPELCAELTVLPVGGHHLSIIDPPHIDAIAAHLNAALAPVGAR